MGNEKIKAADKVAAGIAGGNNGVEWVEAPWFAMSGEVLRPNGEREAIYMPHNVVVNVGKGYALNRIFGSLTASTAGAGLFLHSASATTSNAAWSNVSASQVHSYGNSMPAITFASTHAAGLATATASYSFNASTQTVKGAGVVFYTSASIGTNANESQLALYAYGEFAASRQVQSNDTLNVTLSLSLA
jgi:hypothetical protein